MPRKRKRARPQESSVTGREAEVRAMAEAAGLSMRASRFRQGGCFRWHWMFERHGRRVLDYYPTTGNWRTHSGRGRCGSHADAVALAASLSDPAEDLAADRGLYVTLDGRRVIICSAALGVTLSVWDRDTGRWAAYLETDGSAAAEGVADDPAAALDAACRLEESQTSYPAGGGGFCRNLDRQLA